MLKINYFNDINFYISATAFRSSRIIGGHNVRDGEVPYQILLRTSLLCGGALIKVEGKQAVLTAAHCLPSYLRASDIEVVAGSVHRNRRSSNEQSRRVTQIIRHSYNSRTKENDIAILAFDRAFTENQYVRPIALPSRNQATSGNVVVSGWGRTAESGSTSDTLKSVSIPVVSHSKCEAAYGRGRILDSMMCAGTGGRDSCQGDSGGPLRAESGNYLAGIVSWGRVRQISYNFNR